MVDAGGTTTYEVIANVGELQLCKISNDSVDDGETIPVELVAPVEIVDQLIVIAGLNETTEAQISGIVASVEYSETNRHFTWVESGITADVVSIYFYLRKQSA